MEIRCISPIINYVPYTRKRSANRKYDTSWLSKQHQRVAFYAEQRNGESQEIFCRETDMNSGRRSCRRRHCLFSSILVTFSCKFACFILWFHIQFTFSLWSSYVTCDTICWWKFITKDEWVKSSAKLFIIINSDYTPVLYIYTEFQSAQCWYGKLVILKFCLLLLLSPSPLLVFDHKVQESMVTTLSTACEETRKISWN